MTLNTHCGGCRDPVSLVSSSDDPRSLYVKHHDTCFGKNSPASTHTFILVEGFKVWLRSMCPTFIGAFSKWCQQYPIDWNLKMILRLTMLWLSSLHRWWCSLLFIGDDWYASSLSPPLPFSLSLFISPLYFLFFFFFSFYTSTGLEKM